MEVEDGEAVSHQLLQKGVIVRPLGGYGLPRMVRVSIGLEAQNARFLEALKAC
jgi:histidinol-phosphate aminotransferase